MREARQAASGTNALLQGLVELDAVKYLKPMMYVFLTKSSRLLTCRITAMVPPMQIHLADCKSSNTLTCGLARNKLQLCMLVLSDMRATYWSANVMYRLFERAQSLLGDKNPEATPELEAPPQPVVDIVDVTPDPLWYGISPDFSNVDQLLSPGFSLSEDVFYDFFPNYHVAYEPALLPGVGDENLYNLPPLG